MSDFISPEFWVILLVALVVIGPKDLPKLLRVIGRWTSKARAVAAQFRGHLDDMVRESELKDMEQQWQEENARIMREFPNEADLSTDSASAAVHTEPAVESQADATADIADETVADVKEAEAPKKRKKVTTPSKASRGD